jgi:predicted PurR-regulated permease PerM
LLIVLLIVAIAAATVLALRLLCVVFAGVLLGVFLCRLSQAVEQRTPLPYRVSFAVVSLGLVGFCVAGGCVAIPQIGAQLGDLFSKIQSSVQDLLTRLSEFGWMDQVAEEAPQLGGQVLSNLDAAALLGGAFSSVTGAITATFLVVFIGFFLAFDPETYRRGLLLLVPPRRRRRAAELLENSIDTLWWWTLGRLVAMAVVGVATATGLWLLGIPLALTLGAVAGVVSFVPTIGAVLAIVPALLVAFQQGPMAPVYVLALYLAVQAVENNLITPLVQRKAVSIPPVVLVVSQVLMGLLVGIVGVAIATPLAAVVMELVRETYVEKDDQSCASGSSGEPSSGP